MKPGVTIETIANNSEGEKAGLAEGDIVLAWAQGDRQGEVVSPFDLAAIESEIAPRGAVTLEGMRAAGKQRWVLGPDTWGITTRPDLPEDALSIYREGRELAKAGKPADAGARWRAAAATAAKHSCAWLGPWLLFHAAEKLAEARQWNEADGDYQAAARASTLSPPVKAQLLQAWAAASMQMNDWAGTEAHYREAVRQLHQAGSETMGLARSLAGLGRVAEHRVELEKAADYYRQALAIQETLAPGSLDVAASLSNLGSVASAGTGVDKAEDYYRRALAIREKAAPDSLGVADILDKLGLLSYYRGNPAQTEEYCSRAKAIDEKLSPDSLAIASALNHLGLAAEDLGDLTKAEDYYRRALALNQRLAPGKVEVGKVLNNLANVASERGNLVKSEAYHRQALAIFQKEAPGGLFVAASYHNLGEVAYKRGDLDQAEEYHRQALAIREKATPGNLAVAFSLLSLGNIAAGRGELAKAEDFYRRALAIREKQAPDSLAVAANLNELSNVVFDRGDEAKSEEYLRRALAIYQRLAPGSLNIAAVTHNLGDIARHRKDLSAAEAYYRQALEIRRALAPESEHSAETLAALAGVMRERGQPAAAGELFQQFLAALESQAARLGGSGEIRSGFRATWAGHYREYLDLLMSQKQPELAFQVLERSRARTLLETLSEARIDIRQGVDPSLLLQERSLRATLRAKTNRRIELAEDRDTENLSAVNKDIDGLLSQYSEIEGRIRTTSPKYAALTQPQPLTTQAVQQLLDADSVLLEYALGEQRSYVFALTTISLDAYELPKRAEIESAARRVYDLLTSQNRWIAGESGERRSQRIAAAQADYGAVAGELSRMVLGPVAARLEGKRLLIVSDGSLQYVPFAILPVAGRNVPLVAEHEIVHLPSASVLAALRQEESGRGTRTRKTVAVLADPVFDRTDPRVLSARSRSRAAGAGSQAGVASDAAVRLTRSVGDVGLRTTEGSVLPRLAFSRREAQAILALTAKGSGLEAVDFQASRETATSAELAQYRIVHFATHGLLDNKHPELSGLVLSMVDEEGKARNGFLDLEDIYNLNLPADLVVLSACETGLGKEMGAEGLVGLTRGFMYAGAPRVLASLWKVDDVATAKLMESFYRGMLKEGKRPAAALRQAQLEMWKQGRWVNPYYWGAFTLQGEWQ
ncbi:MAG: CHAT domain-containing protein [Acidobacteriia bacterium]|nr:CHAT domain-containing protein [Terriglobia bacterium]